jgi:hypothetical protein
MHVPNTNPKAQIAYAAKMLHDRPPNAKYIHTSRFLASVAEVSVLLLKVAVIARVPNVSVAKLAWQTSLLCRFVSSVFDSSLS